MNPEFVDEMETPIGWLRICATATGITSVRFEDIPTGDLRPGPVTTACVEQLTSYFQRKRFSFDLPLEANGTEFQHTVWRELGTIPFGETRSYDQVARSVGGVEKTRAVGLANGKNPISIIVPCHRVIGSNGSLTGYAGGLMRKRWLLDHESDQLSFLA